jgi:thiamine-phosphate pyrophosphorylase
MTPELPFGLYALTDPELLPEAVLYERVAAAIEGGAGIVQYRDKPADPATRRRRAGLVADACRAAGVLFIVNDDPALARATGADGVHVGGDDPGWHEARAIIGASRILGVSCYDRLERAEAAARAGADYVAFGSLFPSQTKPGAGRASLALVRTASERLTVPVVGIGGITRHNAAEVTAAGAWAVAVVHDLFGDTDPRAAARALAGACELGRAPRGAGR